MWSAEVAEYCGSSILIFLFQGVLAVEARYDSHLNYIIRYRVLMFLF